MSHESRRHLLRKQRAHPQTPGFGLPTGPPRSEWSGAGMRQAAVVGESHDCFRTQEILRLTTRSSLFQETELHLLGGLASGCATCWTAVGKARSRLKFQGATGPEIELLCTLTLYPPKAISRLRCGKRLKGLAKGEWPMCWRCWWRVRRCCVGRSPAGCSGSWTRLAQLAGGLSPFACLYSALAFEAHALSQAQLDTYPFAKKTLKASILNLDLRLMVACGEPPTVDELEERWRGLLLEERSGGMKALELLWLATSQGFQEFVEHRVVTAQSRWRFSCSGMMERALKLQSVASGSALDRRVLLPFVELLGRLETAH